MKMYQLAYRKVLISYDLFSFENTCVLRNMMLEIDIYKFLQKH